MLLGAIVAGVVGTLVITMVMAMAPKMGMPKMDMVGMLGSMFAAPGDRILGWVIHLMMGMIFALIYALLWNAGVGSASIGSGVVFGIVTWLFAGLMMGVMPMVHAGIKSGDIPEPGVFMFNSGGVLSFMGGLMGHAIFGFFVGLIYPLVV